MALDEENAIVEAAAKGVRKRAPKAPKAVETGAADPVVTAPAVPYGPVRVEGKFFFTG